MRRLGGCQLAGMPARVPMTSEIGVFGYIAARCAACCIWDSEEISRSPRVPMMKLSDLRNGDRFVVP